MLTVELRNYQKVAVKKALTAYAKGARGFLIGDKMGLGKTIEALAIADILPKRHKLILIVAPTALLEKWRHEVRARVYDGRDYEFCFVSYSELADPQKRAAHTNSRYDLIIYDEVHYAKSYKAQRTQGSLYCYKKINPPPVSHCADRLLGLSGTWPPNAITDCYTWLRATGNPIAQNGFEAFANRYSAYVYRSPQGWTKYSGMKNIEEFHKAVAPFFIARDIDDVTDEIPSGVRIIEYLKPSKAVLRQEMAIVELIEREFGDLQSVFADDNLLERALETFPDFSRIAEFRKLQGRTKVASVIEHVTNDILSEVKKVLIFCYHIEIAETYRVEFSKHTTCVKIDGSVPPEKRFEILQRVRDMDECVLVCTLDAVREGFDLIDFSVSVFAEIDWRSWVLEQAEGRTRRLGQLKNVRWVYFVFDSGIDSAIMKTVEKKKSLAESIRQGGL